jgi:hypothetical protein
MKIAFTAPPDPSPPENPVKRYIAAPSILELMEAFNRIEERLAVLEARLAVLER